MGMGSLTSTTPRGGVETVRRPLRLVPASGILPFGRQCSTLTKTLYTSRPLSDKNCPPPEDGSRQ